MACLRVACAIARLGRFAGVWAHGKGSEITELRLPASCPPGAAPPCEREGPGMARAHAGRFAA